LKRVEVSLHLLRCLTKKHSEYKQNYKQILERLGGPSVSLDLSM
jgi:hypothetical protein